MASISISEKYNFLRAIKIFVSEAWWLSQGCRDLKQDGSPNTNGLDILQHKDERPH